MTHAPGRHSPLDGLRAVAAVAVLLTHAAIYSGLASAGGDTARYAQRLEVGVAVFFVISGFVLYRPFVSARLDGRPLPLLGRFAGRRALRIVPAYWLALTVSAVALGLAGVLSLSGVSHVLRVRPDLLAEHAHRRARAGLDAVRRGDVLRVPAAVGLGAAGARTGGPRRDPAPRGARAGRAVRGVTGLEGGLRLGRIARERRRLPVAAFAARLPRPVRARHGPGGADAVATALRQGDSGGGDRCWPSSRSGP